MRIITLAAALLSWATFASAQTAIPAPPDLAPADKYLTNTETTVLETSVPEAWAFWRATPVTDFVEQTDRIPAIASFEVLKGTWGEPGSIRRVIFEGGGSALERVLTSTETEFSYQIWNIDTGSGRFINHIYGKFNAQAVGNGTQITWSYNIKPNVFLARPFISSFLRNDFEPFMESGLQGLTLAFETQNAG